MTDSKIELREMLPSDSTAIRRLIADPNGFITTNFLIDEYTAITAGTEDRTIGVVAERAGHNGLIGMSTVRFGNEKGGPDCKMCLSYSVESRK